jgi:hypothetical protein
MALVKVRSAVGRVVLWLPVRRLKKAMLSGMLLGEELREWGGELTGDE